MRYSAWIPLYPAGILLEMAIIHAAIPLFEISRTYSFSLPNAWNFSFEYGTFLRGYLMMYPIVGPVMLWHMWSQRKKALGGTRSKSASSKMSKSKRKTA